MTSGAKSITDEEEVDDLPHTYTRFLFKAQIPLIRFYFDNEFGQTLMEAEIVSTCLNAQIGKLF